MKILDFILNLGNRPSVILYEISCLLCMMLFGYCVKNPSAGIMIIVVLPVMWLCLLGFIFGMLVEQIFKQLRWKLNLVLKTIHLCLFINMILVSYYVIIFGVLLLLDLLKDLFVGVD